MNVAYALAAYPAGILSDRIDRSTILICGFAVLVAADIALAIAGPSRHSCGRRLAR
jgi:MFS family permease